MVSLVAHITTESFYPTYAISAFEIYRHKRERMWNLRNKSVSGILISCFEMKGPDNIDNEKKRKECKRG